MVNSKRIWGKRINTWSLIAILQSYNMRGMIVFGILRRIVCSNTRIQFGTSIRLMQATFVRVYIEEFKDKNTFFKAFMKNIERIIGQNNDETPKLDKQISILETDLSELITLKLHKEIDEKAYGREYQRISGEITDLQIKKDNIVTEKLEYAKDVGRMQVVKEIIGDGSKPLKEFDDALFETMVEKVIIKSTTEFEFIFESGQRVKGKVGK